MTKQKKAVRKRRVIPETEDKIYSQLGKLLLDRLSPRQIVKASVAAAAVVEHSTTMGQAVKIPRNTKEWLALYTKHVWAYAGVYAIANTIAQLKLQLFKRNKKTKEIEEITDHRSLSTLRKPNPDSTGFDLIESTVVYLECVGMAYWETVKNKKEVVAGETTLLEEKWVEELFPLRPDRVTPEPDKSGNGIKEYKFVVDKRGVGKPKVFRPDEIVPFKYFNPVEDWLGLGSLQVSIDDVRQDKQMASWNLDFFEHGLAAEGIISVKGRMSQSRMEDFARQLTNFLRGKGRKIPVFSTEDGIDFIPLSSNPKDIEFLQGRKENRQAILAALGVPPVMVGLLEHAKYDNYFLQIESFHKETIGTKIKKIESALLLHYLPMFSDIADDEENEYYMLFDTKELLQEDKDRLTDRLVKWIEHGLVTPNEARKQLNMEPYPEGQLGGDMFYMKNTLVPVGQPSEEELERREDKLASRVDRLGDEIEETVESRIAELRWELGKEE